MHLLLAMAALLPLQDATGGDPDVIDFVLPGQFKDAQAKAKKLNRCLIIKGVAFGIDKEGAACATKGHW